MIEDFKTNEGEWATSAVVDGVKHLTRAYSVWNSMMQRCKAGGAYQRKYPSYIGCKHSSKFGSFQEFTEWYREQIGYGLSGYALDKDVLSKKSKVYSEDTCVIIPRQLNSFYTPHTATRDLPQGVYLIKGKYRPSLSIDNKLTYLGAFDDVSSAWAALKVAKEAEARRWAERLEAGEYAVDSRVTTALRNFTMEYHNG